MKKINMSKSTNLTIGDAFELYIRKCTVRNLSDKTILSYKQICANARFQNTRRGYSRIIY